MPAARRERASALLRAMGTKSRETIYGASVRASAERAAKARKEAGAGSRAGLEPAPGER
jgi:hypothetical protein